MNVGRPHSQGAYRAQQRYREAMVELLLRTRKGVQDARREVVGTGAELPEIPSAGADGGAEQGKVGGKQVPQAHANEVLPNKHHEANVHHRDDAAGHHRRDKIEISESSRQVLARLDQALDHADDAEVRPKIERLKEAHRAGELNSPERMARAAERMLRSHAAPHSRA